MTYVTKKSWERSEISMANVSLIFWLRENFVGSKRGPLTHVDDLALVCICGEFVCWRGECGRVSRRACQVTTSSEVSLSVFKCGAMRPQRSPIQMPSFSFQCGTTAALLWRGTKKKKRLTSRQKSVAEMKAVTKNRWTSCPGCVRVVFQCVSRCNVSWHPQLFDTCDVHLHELKQFVTVFLLRF